MPYIENKNILKEVGVLLIALLMILSTAVIVNASSIKNIGETESNDAEDDTPIKSIEGTELFFQMFNSRQLGTGIFKLGYYRIYDTLRACVSADGGISWLVPGSSYENPVVPGSTMNNIIFAEDFVLPLNSPCIDAGTDVGLTKDYAETSVHQSSAQDIGAFECQSNTYYVDASNGNDSWSGLYDTPQGGPPTDGPWLTIQKAANTMIEGDTVYIKEGIYNEQVIPQNSGSPGNYITYLAYPGDTVIINGDGIFLPTYFGGLFEVWNKSYINISGLKIINAGPNELNAGIMICNSSYIIVEKNYTYKTVSSGIGVLESNNIIIDDNEVELACNGGLFGGSQECITICTTDTFEVKNNHVHHGGSNINGAEGIDAKNGSSNGKIYNNFVHHMNTVGIYVDAWDKHTYNIEVFKNTVSECFDGIAVASEQGGLLEDIRIYNNIVYNNKLVGIVIGGWGGDAWPVSEHPTRDIKIINNTVYNNESAGIWVCNPDAENIIIRNNICSQNQWAQIGLDADIPVQDLNLTVDYNLIDGYTDDGEMYGNNYVEGNPKFVNPSVADFHLRKKSPAIDNGLSLNAPSDDFDGNPRPQDAGYDIGAFEYQGNDDYNLDCNGILSWPNVQPGSVVNGSFTVENVGNPGLGIDWCITEWPSWGTWTFTPISGDNLSPEDGPITVEVSVVAPDEQNKGFTGSIKIVNKDNINDFCMVPVSLATPKDKEMISTLFIQFLERVLERFPMLEILLKLPSL